eukprot:TRINITY_DN8103_c1_g1_i1.p1 TRINITY_DN8103_c1_g1~~TRINITY_DN8103_c1_g1_i1.p1  ORF type:complete len:391 (+),score=52.03 TRINITY_DN8103_c1_g1_i1:62-1174(+)
MGRGQGPQGGAGNQGGALSSKSSKPRKPRDGKNSLKKKVVEESEHAESAEPPAYTVIAPNPQQRAEMMRSQRKWALAEHRLAVRAAAASHRPVNGTSPDGEVLGSTLEHEDKCLPLEAHDLRQARMQHLASLHATVPATGSAKERVEKAQLTRRESCDRVLAHASEQRRVAAAEAVVEIPILRRIREAESTTVSDEDAQECADLCLGMLASRVDKQELECALKTLCTILENAYMKEDVKYRRLKASNDKLWIALLKHPEMIALLELTGFRPQRDTAQQELDRQADLDRLQVQIQEQLDGTAWHGEIESLLSRLEALHASQSTSEQRDGRIESDERDVVFVHSSAERTTSLRVALHAAKAWISEQNGAILQ